MNNNDYPVGADNESAPWNTKFKSVEKEIYLGITFPMIVDIPEDYNDDDIELYIRNSIYKGYMPEKFDITELEVI